MIIYTQTPDYYDEYLQHGWLKDQAAKVHKYIERWRGKNGKWYYRYAVNKVKQLGGKAKLKAIDLKTKFNRKKMGYSPTTLSDNYGQEGISPYMTNRGKKSNLSSVHESRPKTTRKGFADNTGEAGSNGITGRKHKEGIEAGRERVANKKKIQKQKTVQKIYNDQQSNRKRTEMIKENQKKAQAARRKRTKQNVRHVSGQYILETIYNSRKNKW